MLGIGFLPSVEHLTNPIIRSAFVSYQRAGSVESAIGTDDNGQDILDIINDPENDFTITPQNTFIYASQLQKLGVLKTEAKSWKDYFFPEAYGENGS